MDKFYDLARVGITLIGSGTPTFEEAIDAAQEIYGIFDRKVQEKSLESWTLSAWKLVLLETLTKEGFLYSEENKVQYYQVHKSDKDIFKIQVLFIAVPLMDNKHKIIMVLRSIALLDPYFSQVRELLITIVLYL
ncbi:hypothetical protein BYT27DRAFT_7221650 [Phlegmacium glaucopus]|nr:hypothetical protein BYT27DRAFT_7221650 [Phlegmacium glaucopus]